MIKVRPLAGVGVDGGKETAFVCLRPALVVVFADFVVFELAALPLSLVELPFEFDFVAFFIGRRPTAGASLACTTLSGVS
ncbi:hypothetical protein P152DRAFT_456529 [Eremomyces bilateralis CBS 781.70]|uniref:Uncharacterized protein n=1 Tax=Eremomyces bilateralis CBS 781.70 TaxID=1392243 RepID=A0A6G1G896_9PEZI|nr:uncharacterized protein P152DRAFT_461084 [Eremomyces bilateralis CBS 781.70]XP_033535918.1 uncharacterized protein P152DRAFT_456529 [Eremomyces bilateralis CBS 781.70]KAF1809707.1 hypothetical protein P152DRAFT_461084 [Eremomyces bilateralis CBS 781.70]KAF1814287.1 hypothetical protein P152DRAFT_456529 [Eremomyces bilateralis CBS 781.70]